MGNLSVSWISWVSCAVFDWKCVRENLYFEYWGFLCKESEVVRAADNNQVR